MNVYSKVKAGGIAGIIVMLITWALSAFLGIELPAEVAQALVVVIGFIVGYLKIEVVGTDLALRGKLRR